MAITVEQKGNKKFRIKCEYCLTQFTYEQEDIGYRLWYPHGFVYCPKCAKPLRHNPELNMIKNEE
ncbi:MAG: hypothetical protein K6B64_03285 [Acholeplasmatales bacterium]|nr:hypothetical protein [Acholeplasmatales bacterium]